MIDTQEFKILLGELKKKLVWILWNNFCFDFTEIFGKNAIISYTIVYWIIWKNWCVYCLLASFSNTAIAGKANSPAAYFTYYTIY